MMGSRLLATAFLSLAFFASPAQPIPGLVSSNYAGLYRVLHNPSAVAGTRYRFQIIPAAGLSTINPVVFKYLTSNDYMGALRLPYSRQLARDLRAVGSITDAPRTNSYSELIGPSVLLSLGRAHGLAVHTRLRSYLYGSSLPEPFTNAYRRSLYSRVLQPDEGALVFNLTHESYAEIGLTYGLQVFDAELHRLRVGATVRRLGGAQRQTLSAQGRYAVRANAGTNEKSLDVTNTRYEGSFTAPIQDFRAADVFSGQYGTGWGYDLGATYELGRRTSGRTTDPNTPYEDLRPAYLLRVSAAVTGGGRVVLPAGQTFTGTLTQTFTDAELERLGNAPLAYLGEEALPATLPYEPGSIDLPRFLNLEADLRLSSSFYLNVLTLQNVGNAAPMPNQVLITPRFEDEDAELALPVSLISPDGKVAVGLSARLGPLALGFSDLNHFFRKNGDNRSSMFWVGVSVWRFRK